MCAQLILNEYFEEHYEVETIESDSAHVVRSGLILWRRCEAMYADRFRALERVVRAMPIFVLLIR
jgi:hypothetical protein